MAKIFLYCDKEHEVSTDNVFLSGVYRDVSHFRKENPDFRPIKSYDADEYVKLMKTQMKPKKSVRRNK